MAADFNGEGPPDILWRNISKSDNYLWCLNDSAVADGDIAPPLADTVRRIEPQFIRGKLAPTLP